MPFSLLALLYGITSARILENSYRSRTAEAVGSARNLAESLIRDASDKALSLSRSQPVIAYLESPTEDPWLLSEVNRLFTATFPSSDWHPYVLPLDGRTPVSSSPLPEEYRLPVYSGWGILGLLSRRDGAEGPVVFAQPHPQSLYPVPLAAGVPVISGERLLGYVIVDAGRPLFAERVGGPSLAGGILTSLWISDSSGCVLYDATDPSREAGFTPRALGSSLSSSAPLGPDLRVSGVYPLSAARDSSSRITGVTFFLAGLSMAVSLILAIMFSRSVALPVHRMTLTMERVSGGDLEARCEETSLAAGDEMALLVRRFNLMIDRVKELLSNLVTQERELRGAEIRALQAQMNPHFLYNTLNSIRSLARLEGAEDIAAMTTSLARIIREGARPRTLFSTVEESLALARDYFALESFRWPGRFTLEESVSGEALKAPIPSLILQPLVENALVHGLERRSGPGMLRIEASVASGDLILRVIDTGAGIEAAALAELRRRMSEAGDAVDGELPGAAGTRENPESEGLGIALVNSHRRLRLVYGAPYGLALESKVGEGTAVTVSIPLGNGGGIEC